MLALHITTSTTSKNHTIKPSVHPVRAQTSTQGQLQAAAAKNGSREEAVLQQLWVWCHQTAARPHHKYNMDAFSQDRSEADVADVQRVGWDITQGFELLGFTSFFYCQRGICPRESGRSVGMVNGFFPRGQIQQ